MRNEEPEEKPEGCLVLLMMIMGCLAMQYLFFFFLDKMGWLKDYVPDQ